jgi:hypothetical protein
LRAGTGGAEDGAVLQPIVSLTLEARREPLADFVAKHPKPVFVVEPFGEQSDEASFETLRPGPQGGLGMLGPAVAVLEKRDGANAFDMMITIGRAKNNDVQILSPQVSKFHAYVMFGPDGAATLTDAGSTCGTNLGGRPLTPRTERAPLADGAQVLMGDVRLTYFSPPALHAYLRGAG